MQFCLLCALHTACGLIFTQVSLHFHYCVNCQDSVCLLTDAAQQIILAHLTVMVLTLKLFIELEILSYEVIYQTHIHGFQFHKCEDFPLLYFNIIKQYNIYKII